MLLASDSGNSVYLMDFCSYIMNACIIMNEKVVSAAKLLIVRNTD